MAKSGLGYSIDIDLTAFTADEPCDVAHAWLMALNLLHYHDVNPQYRVSTLIESTAPRNGQILRHYEFPITLKPNGMPAGLDVRIGVKTQSGTLDVHGRIVLVSTTPPATDADKIGSALVTATSTSTAGEWIENLITFDSSNTPSVGTVGVSVVDGDMSGGRNTQYEARVRLEIEINASGMSVGHTFRLCGVQVREFMG